MTESTVTLPPDSTGSKLRTLTGGGIPSSAMQEVVTLADSDGTLALASRLSNLDIALSALRDAITKTGATAKTLADVVAALASVAVTGPLTDAQLRASAPSVKDDYQTGEVLADQTGSGGVLTFTFAAARNLVLIEAVGTGTQVARADPFGGTPTATAGIHCDDGVPTYLPVTTTVVKVFAPASMVVSAAGFSRT